MISMFKNGGANLSFSRIAAFAIILIGMGLGIGAIATGLNGEPVIEAGKLVTKTVLVGEELKEVQVPVRIVDWDGMGTFWYNLSLGTTLLVTGLYGVNKAADVVGKFAQRDK